MIIIFYKSMHIVTVVGGRQTGKTALCEQWYRPGMTTDSYLSTVAVKSYVLPYMTLNDTPSERRFHVHLESYYACTDVFVLVADKDDDSDEWYSRIHHIAPEASWILLWTGVESCPKKRAWATSLGIPLVYTYLKDAEQVDNAFKHLRRLSEKHVPRPERVPLSIVESIVDEARRWWPCM